MKAKQKMARKPNKNCPASLQKKKKEKNIPEKKAMQEK